MVIGREYYRGERQFYLRHGVHRRGRGAWLAGARVEALSLAAVSKKIDTIAAGAAKAVGAASGGAFERGLASAAKYGLAGAGVNVVRGGGMDFADGRIGCEKGYSLGEFAQRRLGDAAIGLGAGALFGLVRSTALKGMGSESGWNVAYKTGSSAGVAGVGYTVDALSSNWAVGPFQIGEDRKFSWGGLGVNIAGGGLMGLTIAAAPVWGPRILGEGGGATARDTPGLINRMVSRISTKAGDTLTAYRTILKTGVAGGASLAKVIGTHAFAAGGMGLVGAAGGYGLYRMRGGCRKTKLRMICPRICAGFAVNGHDPANRGKTPQSIKHAEGVRPDNARQHPDRISKYSLSNAVDFI